MTETEQNIPSLEEMMSDVDAAFNRAGEVLTPFIGPYLADGLPPEMLAGSTLAIDTGDGAINVAIGLEHDTETVAISSYHFSHEQPDGTKLIGGMFTRSRLDEEQSHSRLAQPEMYKGWAHDGAVVALALLDRIASQGEFAHYELRLRDPSPTSRLPALREAGRAKMDRIMSQRRQ